MLRQPLISCEKAMGVASCRCVRPLLTMPSFSCFQALEGCNQAIHCRDQLILDAQHRRDVHGGGEGIVGGLRHVDMVVGVQKLLARDVVAAVGDDLVGVHVGLGAAARLPHHQREVVVQLRRKSPRRTPA